ILANQSVDFVGLQIERHVAQSRNAAVFLGDISQLDQGLHHQGSFDRATSRARTMLPPLLVRKSRPSLSTELVIPCRLPSARLWKLSIGSNSSPRRAIRP